MFRGMPFDPQYINSSRRHATIYSRYQQAYAWVDAGAAVAFIVGSVFFLDESKKLAAAWLFVVGSVLFALVPSITVLQAMHLDRLSMPHSKGSERR
jgi:hypothetical protein